MITIRIIMYHNKEDSKKQKKQNKKPSKVINKTMY